MLFGLRGLLISVPECEDAFPFSAICRRAFSDSICSQHRSHSATTCSAAAFTVRLAARLAPRERGTNRKFNRRTYEISLGDPCSDDVAQLGRREDFAFGRFLLQRQVLQEWRALL